MLTTTRESAPRSLLVLYTRPCRDIADTERPLHVDDTGCPGYSSLFLPFLPSVCLPLARLSLSLPLAFPLFPEGILAFRTLPLSREENKVFHNACMFTAVVLVSLGLYAVFQVCILSCLVVWSISTCQPHIVPKVEYIIIFCFSLPYTRYCCLYALRGDRDPFCPPHPFKPVGQTCSAHGSRAISWRSGHR